jgi:hypothetical protein
LIGELPILVPPIELDLRARVSTRVRSRNERGSYRASFSVSCADPHIDRSWGGLARISTAAVASVRLRSTTPWCHPPGWGARRPAGPCRLYWGLIPIESRSFSSEKLYPPRRLIGCHEHHRAVGDRLQERFCRPEIEGLLANGSGQNSTARRHHTTGTNPHHGLKKHRLRRTKARSATPLPCRFSYLCWNLTINHFDAELTYSMQGGELKVVDLDLGQCRNRQ